jgi:hypothetical protein
MIQAKPTDNWAIIGTCIATGVAILGWIANHWLSLRRDRNQRRSDYRKAVSDLEWSINGVLDCISERHQVMPTSWVMFLTGPVDINVKALRETHGKTIQQIEGPFKIVRGYLNGADSEAFDTAWQKYQCCQIDGPVEQYPQGEGEFTNLTNCRIQLQTALQQIQKIVREAKI